MTHTMHGVRLASVVLGLTLVAACGGSSGRTSERVEPPPAAVTADLSTLPDLDGLDLPEEARVSDGGGQPRPPAYWAVWNSCAPDNRTEVAAANGGREAGWFLVDDLLADPGIQLGEHRLTTCAESLALLQARTAAGDETGDPAYLLAAQLLAAELSLGAGAETCPVLEELLFGAHLVLSTAGFDGLSASPLDPEAGGAAPELTMLLSAYNAGDLCR
jgi:hypothetical protein